MFVQSTKKLKKQDNILLREGYEAFKIYQYDRCIALFDEASQCSGILEFIQRNYSHLLPINAPTQSSSPYTRLTEQQQKILRQPKKKKKKKSGEEEDENVDEQEGNRRVEEEEGEKKTTGPMLKGLVYLQCGLVQLVDQHRQCNGETIEIFGTVEEKYEYETRKDTIFKTLKQCLSVLEGCEWTEVNLTRANKFERGEES